MSDTNQDDRLSDDLVWGVRGKQGIAAFIGQTERKTYHLIDKGRLPVTRLGARTIVASKSKLRDALRGGT